MGDFFVKVIGNSKLFEVCCNFFVSLVLFILFCIVVNCGFILLGNILVFLICVVSVLGCKCWCILNF